MTRKRIPSGYWYSDTHLVYHNPPLKIECVNGDQYIHFTCETAPDNTLYSQAQYRTKIKKEDLPVWYMRGRFFKQWGYLNTKAVTDIAYIPNKHVNHLFRDDCLYVKCGGTLEKEIASSGWLTYSNYDMLLDGYDMLHLLAYLHVFSNWNVDEYLKQLKEKVEFYAKEYPNEHDVITIEEFDDIWTKTLNEVQEHAEM